MTKSSKHKTGKHKKHQKQEKSSWFKKLEGKLLYVLYALIILIFLITTIHASMFSQDDYEGMGDSSDCCGEYCCGDDLGCVDEKDDDADDTEDTTTTPTADTLPAGSTCTTTTKSISSTAGTEEFTGSFSVHYCGDDTTMRVYFTRAAGLYVAGAIYSDWDLPGYSSITITNNSDVGTSWSFPSSHNFSKACMVIGSVEECS